MEDGKLTDKWYLVGKKRMIYLQDHKEEQRNRPGKGSGIWAIASSERKSLEEATGPPKAWSHCIWHLPLPTMKENRRLSIWRLSAGGTLHLEFDVRLSTEYRKLRSKSLYSLNNPLPQPKIIENPREKVYSPCIYKKSKRSAKSVFYHPRGMPDRNKLYPHTKNFKSPLQDLTLKYKWQIIISRNLRKAVDMTERDKQNRRKHKNSDKNR